MIILLSVSNIVHVSVCQCMSESEHGCVCFVRHKCTHDTDQAYICTQQDINSLEMTVK